MVCKNIAGSSANFLPKSLACKDGNWEVNSTPESAVGPIITEFNESIPANAVLVLSIYVLMVVRKMSKLTSLHPTFGMRCSV